MKDQKSKLDEYLAKQTPEALMLAILESDKILVEKLNSSTIPGKSINDKIRNAIDVLTDPLGLIEAREVAEAIRNTPNYDLTDVFGDSTLLHYQKALEDLDKEIPRQKLIAGLQRIFFSVWRSRKKYKSGLLIVFGFLVGVIFFSDTSIGGQLSAIFVSVVHGVFSGLFFVVAGVVVAFAIVVLFVLVIEKFRK